MGVKYTCDWKDCDNPVAYDVTTRFKEENTVWGIHVYNACDDHVGEVTDMALMVRGENLATYLKNQKQPAKTVQYILTAAGKFDSVMVTLNSSIPTE